MADLRERVARIIEPKLWKMRDEDAAKRDHYDRELKLAWSGLPFEEWAVRGLDDSLSKADAILALLPANQGGDK